MTVESTESRPSRCLLVAEKPANVLSPKGTLNQPQRGLIQPHRAVDSAPKGRNNEAQANGLGLDHPPILPPALKGRDRCSPMPQSLSQLHVHHATRNPPPRGELSRGIPEAARRARDCLRRAVRVGLKRIVPPLQGSGVDGGFVDPGRWPGLR